jgi:hypothetical protein
LKFGRSAQMNVWLLAVCEAPLRGNENYTNCSRVLRLF